MRFGTVNQKIPDGSETTGRLRFFRHHGFPFRIFLDDANGSNCGEVGDEGFSRLHRVFLYAKPLPGSRSGIVDVRDPIGHFGNSTAASRKAARSPGGGRGPADGLPATRGLQRPESEGMNVPAIARGRSRFRLSFRAEIRLFPSAVSISFSPVSAANRPERRMAHMAASTCDGVRPTAAKGKFRRFRGRRRGGFGWGAKPPPGSGGEAVCARRGFSRRAAVKSPSPPISGFAAPPVAPLPAASRVPRKRAPS